MMRANMKSIILLLMAIPLIGLIACSDPQKAPTTPQSKVSVHPQGWTEFASPNFHGKDLATKKFAVSACRSCHGSQYEGGLVGVSCKNKTCHPSFPHPADWADITGANAHTAFIKNEGYNLNSCKSCHGQNYATVKVDNSCLTCHTKQDGPEACNTCHGNFSGDPADIKNLAPPRGLDGETSSTTPAVGAHQAHLLYYQSLSIDACQECHNVPANFAAAGHIDADGKAENPFNGTLVRLKTEGNNRVPNPLYEATTNSCSGTYCHGNWGLLKSQSTRNFAYAADKMEGATASPKWIDAATAACGTCHGLPPTGHIAAQLNTCANCHSGVVDATGKIIDNTKHVNGKINVFGVEEPMK